MQIRVHKDAGAQRIAHTNWTESKLNGAVIKPALNDIADVLINTLVKKFSGPIRYRGDMASGFGKVSIDDNSVGIVHTRRDGGSVFWFPSAGCYMGDGEGAQA